MEQQLLNLILEDPEGIANSVHTYIEKFKPALYAFLKDIFECYKDFSNNEEYFKVCATVKKNMFDAYKKAGFTTDQAMSLILNDDSTIKKAIQNINANVSKIQKSK